MKKLRHAAIGCGNILKKHIEGYMDTGKIETVALSDANEEKLSAASALWGITDITTDYREILSRKDVDLVSINVPNYLHAPIAVEALRAGKHVHVEKPMAMNADGAAGMVEAADASGKILMVGLNNRFTPHAQYVKNLVRSGWLGELYFSKCGWLRRNGLPYSGWFGEKEFAGGGALIDLGVHYIDMVMYMMDYPKVDSVTARTYSKFGGTQHSPVYAFMNMPIASGLKFDVEDLAAGMISLKNDATLMFEISWASNIEKEYNFYELYGTKGGLRFVVDLGDGYPGDASLKLYGMMNGQLVDLEPLVTENAYPMTEFSHFVDCIASGKPSEIVPPWQGVEMMRIVDAIYESSETKRQIVF